MSEIQQNNLFSTLVTDYPKGKYLYETHCHVQTVSRCSHLSPEAMVNLYVQNGYTGVFVTDHFLNGNCLPEIKDEPDFRRQVGMYFEGYRQVKQAAAGKLDVFPGYETTYRGTDILVYGWDEEVVREYPQIMQMSMREFIEFANAHGALTVQAHPFREANYIDHIRLFPGTQGVEIYNAQRDDLSNGLACAYYAAYHEAHGMVRTGGSDAHADTIIYMSGMAFDTPLTSVSDFIARVRRGEGEIFRHRNVLVRQEN